MKPGDIIEFNGTVFASFIEEWENLYYDIVVDNPDNILIRDSKSSK
ncbi:hypothetical protein KHA80_15500 [Anaerobacillus sp. HL2]|nr:hypothetical protein KHA80_15500 [Anaerobacillus sp. HL2]